MRRTILPTALFLLAANALAVEPHHVQLAVSHGSESVRWYIEHLECEAMDARPDSIMCGGMEIEFESKTTLGGSQGTGLNHISFSYADVSAKMDALEAVGVRGSGVRLQRFADGSTIQPLPGVFDHGFIFDPWGTRIELVEDPDKLGFHHVGLQSTDPEAALEWYASQLGGERAKLKGTLDGVKFGDLWLLIEEYPEGRPARTDERAIEHIGFASGELANDAQRLAGSGVDIQDPSVPEGARAEAARAYVAGPDGVLIALVEPGWAGVEEAVRVAVASSEEAEPYAVPQLPWGEPDLQGIWTGNPSHGIPLERPEELKDVANVSAEEAAARRERGTLRSIWGYEREWRDTTLGYDKTAISTQVAMVIDPPDGRLPEMTDHGKAMVAEAAARRGRLAGGPEDLSSWVRCITRGLPGMMMPGVYNNGLQIVQSPGYVAIQKEMIHETRVIPTTEKPHLGENIKQWLGNSRGYWDGETLVVQVRGFNGRSAYMGAGENLTLTERYTRVGEDSLEYQFTVDDPTVWTAPWTAKFQFAKDDGQYELVEYACHEGNYGMSNILSAARARERQAQDDSAGED